ncbi:ABC transporter permease [Pseudomonas kairouanensis]|uniref:ABC transporter permease n=1 Tax=Pseudomonas kairouanensis TaxID=2293832 RepID=A0A4Z0AKT9_9PSED|nr:ABC transporter permease [Pseudomonas kairouanensis]TFY86799.1 ABC transporter permease [Pseudomonas kairouanensis]
MSSDLLCKPFLLAGLFVKEQLKEPIALFWMVISPVTTFYLIIYARSNADGMPEDYLSVTSWFYAFVACSVAFFGLAFYIIGRRESGFLRSFVYTGRTKAIFLFGQYFAYSFISIVYCTVFYCFTRPYFGPLAVAEFFDVLARFYTCYVLFSAISLLFTLIPMGFQNTNTAFSVLSFLMLGVGVASVNSSHRLFEVIKVYNPMWWANQVMSLGVSESIIVVLVAVMTCFFAFWITLRFLVINPVWSRY